MGKILRGENLNVVLDRIYSNCGIQVEKHCTTELYVCLRKLHITPQKNYRDSDHNDGNNTLTQGRVSSLPPSSYVTTCAKVPLMNGIGSH
jgi:hypothetical protein